MTESDLLEYRPLSASSSEEFDAYLEYNKVLRSWFVAFGVGGPALFLINSEVSDRLVAKHQIQYVAALFLIGTGCQVVGAVINKIANWYVYRGTFDKTYLNTRRYTWFKWLVQQFWIDIALDLTTIVLFGFAVWALLTVFSQTK